MIIVQTQEYYKIISVKIGLYIIFVIRCYAMTPYVIIVVPRRSEMPNNMPA